jgi:hypothetical protein
MPLFDPLLLAVKSQIGRLERNPETFDFSWLQERGGPLGEDALAKFNSAPASLRGTAPANPVAAATPVLPTAQPINAPEPPSPPVATPQLSPVTMIQGGPAGVDIILHTAFPAGPLAQDWYDAFVGPCRTRAAKTCDVWLLDLDGDGRKEILFAYVNSARVWANVVKQEQGRWVAAALVTSPPCQEGLVTLMRGRDELADKLPPGWRAALVAGMRQGPGAPAAQLPCPRS